MSEGKRNKKLSIGVWDLTFYLMDDDGEEVLNNDGTVKMFDAPELDLSWIVDSVEFDDLEELESNQYVHKSDLIDPVAKSKEKNGKP